MSEKKRKQLQIMGLILAVLVIVLAGAVLLNKWAAQREEQAEDAAIPRLITMEEITGLTFTNGDSSLSFQKGEDGSWYWADDQDFPLDDSSCTELAELAGDFKAEQQLDIVDQLDAYGLEEPAQKLTLTNGAGESATILLGIQTGGLYYAMVEGEGQIYTIDSTLTTNLSKSLYDMAELADYPVLSSDIMKDVTIQGKHTEAFTVQEVEVEAENSGDSSEGEAASSDELETETEYHWFRGESDVTDQSQITSLRTELDQISLDSLAYYKPTEEERAACGLNDPTAVVTVRYTQDGETVTSVLTLGAYVEESDSYYGALDTNPEEIYLIQSDTVKNAVDIAENGFTEDSGEAE